jgi:hypothetical protein
MLLAGFKPTIPVFERSKNISALDRTATGSGTQHTNSFKELVALCTGSYDFLSKGKVVPVIFFN